MIACPSFSAVKPVFQILLCSLFYHSAVIHQPVEKLPRIFLFNEALNGMEVPAEAPSCNYTRLPVILSRPTCAAEHFGIGL